MQLSKNNAQIPGQGELPGFLKVSYSSVQNNFEGKPGSQSSALYAANYWDMMAAAQSPLRKTGENCLTLFIKNMESISCKMVVQAILRNMGVRCVKLGLGEVEIGGNISLVQLEQMKTALHEVGMELLDGKKNVLIEKIKIAAKEVIHYPDDLPRIKNSAYISDKLNYNYTYLATLFMETEGITVEHFIIRQKIELVKELLLAGQLSLSKIAQQLSYSSTAHLSAQFKKVTGQTPSFFKQRKNKMTVATGNL